MHYTIKKTHFLKKKAFLPALLFAAFMMIFCAQAASAENVLKVGGDCAYPPFTYMDSAGNLKGFDIDIAREIARRLDMKMQHQCVTWDGMIPGLLAGKYDVIIAALDSTPERAKHVDFSIPYYRAPSVFVGLKTLAGAPLDKEGKLSADFLQSKNVGLLRASIFEKYMRNAYPGVNLSLYNSMDDALLDLYAGRIDLALMDKPKVEADFLHKSQNAKFGLIGPDVKDYAILGEGAAAAFRKDSDVLREKVNNAIKAMIADGTYDKISRKYWPFSVKP